MIALGAWIGDMGAANLLHLPQEAWAGQDCQAQLLPILALATSDYIVNGRQAQFLMIKMPVNHNCSHLSFNSALIPTHPTQTVNSRLPTQNVLLLISFKNADNTMRLLPQHSASLGENS